MIPTDLGIPFIQFAVPLGAESCAQLVNCPAERVAPLKCETPPSKLKAAAQPKFPAPLENSELRLRLGSFFAIGVSCAA